MDYNNLFKVLRSAFTQITMQDLIDILIIALLLYKLVMWARDTRAYGVLKGIGILFMVSILSQLIGFTTLSWLLHNFLQSGSIFVVICVLFQPEIRRVLERLGSTGHRIGRGLFAPGREETRLMVESVRDAILHMSRQRVGALIVFEQRTGLGDIIDTGTRIEGLLSGPLLENIFVVNTPLHDGAVIIRSTTIVAAACILPLSDDPTVARELGTRHRAALGIATASDSVTIVVSEETGAITIAEDGKLTRYVDSRALTDRLTALLMPKESESVGILKKVAGRA